MSASVSYTAPLARAWDHMKRLLFRPFDLGRWCAIGFTAWIAQFGQGGGRINFNAGESLSKGNGGVSWDQVRSFLQEYLWIIVGVGTVLLLLGVAFSLLVLWLSSRGRFLFLDNVVRERAEIRAPWRAYAREGNSLFGWRIVFSAVCFITVLLLASVIAVAAVGIATQPSFRAAGILAIVAAALLLLAFSFAAGYTALFLDHFVVPIMHGFRVTAQEAWRRFLPLLRASPWCFIAYGLFFFVLSLGAAAAVLATCCCCCLAAIPYVGSVLLLPVTVLFRAYGVAFLGQFLPEIDLPGPPVPAKAPAPAAPPRLPEGPGAAAGAGMGI